MHFFYNLACLSMIEGVICHKDKIHEGIVVMHWNIILHCIMSEIFTFLEFYNFICEHRSVWALERMSIYFVQTPPISTFCKRCDLKHFKDSFQTTSME